MLHDSTDIDDMPSIERTIFLAMALTWNCHKEEQKRMTLETNISVTAIQAQVRAWIHCNELHNKRQHLTHNTAALVAQPDHDTPQLVEEATLLETNAQAMQLTPRNCTLRSNRTVSSYKWQCLHTTTTKKKSTTQPSTPISASGEPWVNTDPAWPRFNITAPEPAMYDE